MAINTKQKHDYYRFFQIVLERLRKLEVYAETLAPSERRILEDDIWEMKTIVRPFYEISASLALAAQ